VAEALANITPSKRGGPLAEVSLPTFEPTAVYVAYAGDAAIGGVPYMHEAMRRQATKGANTGKDRTTHPLEAKMRYRVLPRCP